jgi:hypothetical protein
MSRLGLFGFGVFAATSGCVFSVARFVGAMSWAGKGNRGVFLVADSVSLVVDPVSGPVPAR